MKISFVNPIGYTHKVRPIQNKNTCQTPTFKGEMRRKIFDPQAERIADMEYRQHLIEKHTTYKKDSQGNLILDRRGNPIRVVKPEIKKIMDETEFLYEGKNVKHSRGQ